MADLPTGTVSFLFTDIEGSTKLLEELGEVYVDLLEEHHLVLQDAIEEAGGIRVSTEGDAFDPPPDWSPDRLLAKIAAGADFFQTQFCFDMEVCRRYMARLVDSGIAAATPFLIGIAPFASAKQARWMDANLYGVSVPEAIIDRLAGAVDEAAEGQRICLEMLQALQDIPGVAGAHIMAPGGEARAAAVIAESGILAARSAGS